MASKIFISNFDSPFWVLGGRFYHYANVYSGRSNRNVQVLSNDAESRRSISSRVIASLLTHDSLCVATGDMLRIAAAIGNEDTITLLACGAIEVLDDGYYEPTLIRETEGRSKLGYVCSLRTAVPARRRPFQELETMLRVQFDESAPRRSRKLDLDRLQLSIERRRVGIDFLAAHKSITEELKYDLKNANLRPALGITSTDTDSVNDDDLYSVLRLAQINRALVYANHAGSTAVSAEAAVRDVVSAKLSPALRSSTPTNPTDAFRSILTRKGLPDLGGLYVDGIITMDDILALREQSDGMLFRHWFMSVDYSESKATALLLSRTKPSFKSAIARCLRWLYPNIVGLVSAVGGLVASGVDSLIVERILRGWHPAMFLDDKLKSRLDKRISAFHKQATATRVRRLHPHAIPGDPCPCGSKKKFRSCCGAMK